MLQDGLRPAMVVPSFVERPKHVDHLAFRQAVETRCTLD